MNPVFGLISRRVFREFMRHHLQGLKMDFHLSVVGERLGVDVMMTIYFPGEIDCGFGEGAEMSQIEPGRSRGSEYKKRAIQASFWRLYMFGSFSVVSETNLLDRFTGLFGHLYCS